MRDSQQQTSSQITDAEFVKLVEGRPAILVFAPSARSPSFESQMQLLEGADDEFASRNAVLVQVLVEGDSYLQDRRLAETAVKRLREEYSVTPVDFCVIVSDGSRKAIKREDAPLQPEALFAHMDGES